VDRTDMKRAACQAIDARQADIIQLAQRILAKPELGYKETATADVAKGVFAELGFAVREGLALTGVDGTLAGGQPGPTVLVMGELDAVMCREAPQSDPVTGAAHQCGHHIQMASMLGAAMGLAGANIAKHLAGATRFLGAPAEEYLEIEYRLQLKKEGKLAFLGGKQELLRQGYFDDVAMAMMVHAFGNTPEPAFLWNGTGNGFLAKFVRYRGKAAHAGAVPHEGVNALNAACLGVLAIHAQRETFQDEHAIRVHPIITKGGDVVNVVPADVRLETYVRGKNLDAILDASAKVERALKAGGDAVGAQTSIENVPGYLPILQDAELTRIAQENGRSLLGDRGMRDAGFMGGSFDVGDLSHVLPVVHPFVGGTRGSLHTAEFTITDYEAAAVLPAKLMAMTVIDLLADGAQAARRVTQGFKPLLTKAAYLELMDKVIRPR